MSQPPPIRLHIDPPIDQWQIIPRNGRTKPIIATGHQPTLWHPGILAKDLAAHAIAKHVGGSALHVVVEHNPLGPVSIDLPTVRASELGKQRIEFGNSTASATLPPNRLPALDPQVVERALAGPVAQARADVVSAGLEQIRHAYRDSSDVMNLAAQTTTVLAKLKQPLLHTPMQALPTSELVTQGFVDRLLADPVGCVRSYNRAAIAYPEAGIRPLYLGRDVVEVPLWAQGVGRCTPVFFDLGDSGKPLLFTQGQSLDLTGNDALQHLRPRAITLSAIMRSELCDLFIHGTGGGVYDQVTERWWHDWLGEELAPKAVVSADVYLPFEVPTATQDEFARAQWFAHHARHNIDRFAAVVGDTEANLRQEKHDLLERMNDDRDKRRRARAFRRIHAINAEFRERHSGTLLEARRLAAAARVGIANRAITCRRDWCFALYPYQQMKGLANEISSRLTASP